MTHQQATNILRRDASKAMIWKLASDLVEVQKRTVKHAGGNIGIYNWAELEEDWFDWFVENLPSVFSGKDFDSERARTRHIVRGIVEKG